MIKTTGVRGIRNNNPGNIEKGARWKGLAKQQLDSRFATFVNPLWGIRAMGRILRSYRRRGVKTVAQIINVWAPSHRTDGTFENHTKAYIDRVCHITGWEPSTVVTEADYAEIAYAMHIVENGGHFYNKRMFVDGMKLLDA